MTLLASSAHQSSCSRRRVPTPRVSAVPSERETLSHSVSLNRLRTRATPSVASCIFSTRSSKSSKHIGALLDPWPTADRSLANGWSWPDAGFGQRLQSGCATAGKSMDEPSDSFEETRPSAEGRWRSVTSGSFREARASTAMTRRCALHCAPIAARSTDTCGLTHTSMSRPIAALRVSPKLPDSQALALCISHP